MTALSLWTCLSITVSAYSSRTAGNGKKWIDRTSAVESFGAGDVGRRPWYTISEVKGVKEDCGS